MRSFLRVSPRRVAGSLAIGALALLLGREAGLADPKFPRYEPQAQEPEERVKEALDFLVEKMRPDEEAIQKTAENADPKKTRKLGVERWMARWDKTPQWALAALATGKQVDEANEALLRWLRDYAAYGEKEELLAEGETNPCRAFRLRLLPSTNRHLSEELKDEIEIAAYQWAKHFSVVDPQASPLHNATAGPWVMSGSENHDATDKRSTLLGLQILGNHGKKYNADTKMPDGRTVRQHYDAWKAYWKETIRQKAREGLFCEIAHSSSYGRATMGLYFDIYDFTDDPELKRLADQMLTLHFAQLAGEYEPKTGIRGAIAMTRAKESDWQLFGYHWAKELAFVWGWGDAHDDKLLITQAYHLTTTWRPPAIVTAIARGPRATPYFSIMRNFGLGGDKKDKVHTIEFADGGLHNSYIVRRSWVAPEYMISGITVDSSRDYLAPGEQARMAGVTFPTGFHDRIVVLGRKGKTPAYRDLNTIVGKDCLVAGRDPGATSTETKVFVANALWKSRQEDPGGWQFFQAGDGYCAIRTEGGTLQRSPHQMGWDMIFEDKDSPVVLQTGRAADYPGGLQGFKEAVLKNTQFIFRDNGLEYVSLAGDRFKFWVREKRIPEINGKPVDLNPEKTYSSPYLSMVHGTDKAVVKYPGYDDLVLDFSYGRK